MLSCFLLPALAAEPAYVVSTATAPTWRILGGKGEASLLLNPSTGASAAALDVLTIEAGGAVPLHQHDTSAEILYVLEGEVRMTIGAMVTTARAGDAVYIPAATPHEATAVTRLRAVQVYVGPGPEERFKAGEKIR